MNLFPKSYHYLIQSVLREGMFIFILKQLDLIGVMTMDNVITTDQTQIDMAVGTFRPRQRYGTLVVVNNAAAAAFHSDMVETSFVFTPLTHRIED